MPWLSIYGSVTQAIQDLVAPEMQALHGEIQKLEGKIEGIEGKIEGVVGKIEGIEGKFDGRFKELDAKIDGLRGEMNVRFESVDKQFKSVDRRFESVDKRLDSLEATVKENSRKFDSFIEESVEGYMKSVNGYIKSLDQKWARRWISTNAWRRSKRSSKPDSQSPLFFLDKDTLIGPGSFRNCDIGAVICQVGSFTGDDSSC